MTKRAVGQRFSRFALLRISVVLGLLAGFALSPKLWMSSRLYPLTPVWPFLRPFPQPWDHVVFFMLIALLVAAAIAARRAVLIAALSLLILLALQDQSRWQPWFYQYFFMLLTIVLAGTRRDSAALNTCCLIVAAVYFWSGLAKLNPYFVDGIFPQLAAPFMGGRLAHYLAFAAPILECAAGIGLLFRRFRSAALCFAIAMHVLILISIGPLGRTFNAVVWPWNLAMIAFLLILFLRRNDQPAFRDILWGREFAFQKVVLLFFGCLPALSFFNLWDHYLSLAMYSGNRNAGVVYLSDDVFDRLPPAIQDSVTDDAPNRNRLDINEWSFDEMNVPSYPEIRVYRNVARGVCGYAMNDPAVELVVQGKLALLNSKRRLVYRCAELK